MRFAVIGQGSAGRRHVELLAEAGHEVVGFDPGIERGASETPLAATLEEALSDVQAAVVASPNSLHAEHADAGLRGGVHVLVEKPLATSAADAEALAALAASRSLHCGVAMNLRFHPCVLYLRELLDSGALGTVRFARASFGYDLRLWRPGTDHRASYSARAELGGGIVFDAIHEIDYLLWLLGPVASVSAEMTDSPDPDIDVEDLAVAALRFCSGTLGTLDVNFFEPAYRRGCVLAGTEATASWDWPSDSVTVQRRGAEPETRVLAGDLRAGYRAELADFVGSIDSGGEPRTPAREGAAAVRVVEALKRSAEDGRRMEVGAGG